MSSVMTSFVASRFDFCNYHTTDLIRSLFILAITESLWYVIQATTGTSATRWHQFKCIKNDNHHQSYPYHSMAASTPRQFVLANAFSLYNDTHIVSNGLYTKSAQRNRNQPTCVIQRTRSNRRMMHSNLLRIYCNRIRSSLGIHVLCRHVYYRLQQHTQAWGNAVLFQRQLFVFISNCLHLI